MTDDNPHAVAWKRLVGTVAAEQFAGAPWECAVAVEFWFYMPRPAWHWGSGRNEGLLVPRAKSLIYPMPQRGPDVLKLARSTEDALTGLVWVDDTQIVDETLHKRYCRWREETHARLLVWPMNTAGSRNNAG